MMRRQRDRTDRPARVLAAIAVGVLAGCVSAPTGAPSAAAPSAAAPSPVVMPAPPDARATSPQVEHLSGAVVPSAVAALPGEAASVTVTDLAGASGSELMVVLYAGTLFAPDGTKNDRPFAGLAGFAGAVHDDPVTIVGILLSGPPRWTARPPAFGDRIAAIPPGPYTLIVWVGNPLGAYGDWVPGDPIERWCFAPVEVAWGAETDLTVPAPLPRASGPPGGPCDPSPVRS
jgi:hypothetical protein